MSCANTSSSHIMKLLFIGKANKPRAFANSVIPICCRGQRKKDIFCE